MFAKVLVFAIAVAAATGQERLHYKLKNPTHHDYSKEFRHQAYEHIQYHPEPSSSEEYKLPESHGHAYSSQSIHHEGQAGAYQESHESNTEHVAPVYQYVDEHNEDFKPHEAPKKQKYHVVHIPSPVHEVKNVHVPVHHKTPVHYQPESHEHYHHPIHHSAPVHSAPIHEAPIHEPVHHESHESHDEPLDYYAYPKYQYEYKVEDPHTGDNKFQHEIRDGDVVKGVYGLHEADGSIRTVEYSSDKHNGFSAIVKHTAPGQHVQIETHHQN